MKEINLVKIATLRGLTSDFYNQIEESVNKLITLYFNPNNKKDEFQYMLLNSSIIGIGQKIKILANIESFDSKIVAKLRRFTSIRNGITHTNPIPHVKGQYDEVEVTYKISVMNSEGKLKEKDFIEYYDVFSCLFSEIKDYLDRFKSNLKNN